jgi:hypothetical protein
MTTSWALLLRGDVTAAVDANAGGAVLALLAIMAIPVLTRTAIRGQTPGQATSWFFACSLLLVIFVALIQWLDRIA